MNSHSDDDMFSRYRAELVMDAEARARTFRKLQERVLRGEQPVPELDVQPPQVPALHGLWSLPAKWAVTIVGLGVGALFVANLGLRSAPPSAATSRKAVAAERAQLEAAVPEQTGTARAGASELEVAVPEQTKSAAADISRAQVPARALKAGAQLNTAARSQKAGTASRMQERAQPRPQTIEGESWRADDGAAPSSEQSVVAEAQPSAAAVKVASPKGKDAIPQRSEQAIASETLSKELQLLQAAQLALRAGDTQRSLALLAEHTWSYPQGHLAEARDVARILALCQAGHVTQSQRYAKRFLQQRPKSPYALRVQAGCSAMTEASAQEPR